MGDGNKVWAAQRQESKQKNGKLSSKFSSVSFDDAGNYLKSEDNDGEVSTDFKKLDVPIQSGKEMQDEYDRSYGRKKGGVITCKMSTHKAKKNANW